MAGDRGMRYPELTGSSLQHLKDNIPAGCSDGYSSSRTCEVSLSNHRCACMCWVWGCVGGGGGRGVLPGAPAAARGRPRHQNTHAHTQTLHTHSNNHTRSGINFRSLVYLVDEATRPKAGA